MRIVLNGHKREPLFSITPGETFIYQSGLYMRLCTYSADAKALFSQFAQNTKYPVVRLSTGEFEFLPGEYEVEPISGHFKEGATDD